MSTLSPTSAGQGRVKPLLRGVSHLGAFLVAVPLGAALIAACPPGRPAAGTAVYVASLCALLGMSALYHVPTWSPRARALLSRADHAAIFVLIAGTYTPLSLLASGPGRGGGWLALVWAAAALGVLQALFVPRLRRGVRAALYVALGGFAALDGRGVAAAVGPTGALLIAGGGLLYVVGAAIYASKRPDPAPRVFGYHEIFHALVVAAAALHFICVRGVVLAAG